MTTTLFAPAKVNLFLKVQGKRADGYHELLTVFQTVDLCDTLHLELSGKGIRLEVPEHLPKGQGNLAYAAACLFYKAIKAEPRVSITIEKRIPTEAGLGGGSSNAAHVLLALNRLHGYPLSLAQMLDLTSHLGSDVAFFLYGGTAVGRGRGEVIQPLPSLYPLWYRIVKPPFGLKTPLVFATWDGTSTADWQAFKQSLAGLPEDLRLFNDLERPAFFLRPELATLKAALLQDGAMQAVLSGSGSSLFGVYHTQPCHTFTLPAGYRQWVVKALPRTEG